MTKSRVLSRFVAIGEGLLTQLGVLAQQFALLRLTLVYLVVGRRQKGQTAEQLYLIGNRSVVFVSVTLGFLGMISIFQVAVQLKRILPDYSMVGAAFLKVMVREFAPTVTGLMVATRTGSGIAAEIGSMVVTEQVDALKMSNADPVNYLVVPRFVACVSMLFCLTILAVLVAGLTGMAMGHIGFGIQPRTFWNLQLIVWQDLVVGGLKALAYGAAIPIIAAHAGLEARGGSEGVGWATTRAVVNSSFAVIVLDLILSAVGYAFLSE